MISYKDPLYIVNGDMLADVVGSWINTCGFERVIFQASWSAVASTNGSFTVEGTCDQAHGNVVPVGIFSSLVASTTAGTGFVIAAMYGTFNGDAAGNALLPLPEFVRLRYQRSTGGAANQLQVQVIGRQ